MMNHQEGSNPAFRTAGSAQWYNGSFSAEPLRLYTLKTFGWMFLGLLATFASAVFFLLSGAMFTFLRMGLAGSLILLIAEIAVVSVLSARLDRLSINAARGLFFGYAILNGITFSTILAAFNHSVVLLVFALSCIYFGVLAAYGWLTKRDLTGIRPVLTVGLVLLLVFGLISMFLPFTMLDRILCLGGLFVFMGLTAYDTQKIRHLHAAYSGNYEMAKKSSIIAALQLYLDFLNIFLYMLRLFQHSNDN